MEPRDEASLLMRAANRGDATAYRRLLELLAPRLRAFVRRGLTRIGRSTDDHEDIVQEALLALHLKRHTWDESQPLEPWVRAIAHHKLVDGLRRRGFQVHVPIDDNEEVSALSIAPSDPVSLDAADLLDRLPEKQRQIVQGMSVEGRTAREVGERLGMSEGAVRVALHRSLKTLASLYGKDAE